ncbi:MAG TPA: hypothetical protein PLD23_00835 [Armatimonadota bacterium]|nr:hypothetical protein [Armatimonadota bacterium]HQK92016.1 hypothetical protein [Armatimonadota bacterium]
MKNWSRIALAGCLALLVVAVPLAAGCKKGGDKDSDAKVLDLNEKRTGGGLQGSTPAPGATR